MTFKLVISKNILLHDILHDNDIYNLSQRFIEYRNHNSYIKHWHLIYEYRFTLGRINRDIICDNYLLVNMFNNFREEKFI